MIRTDLLMNTARQNLTEFILLFVVGFSSGFSFWINLGAILSISTFLLTFSSLTIIYIMACLWRDLIKQ